MRRTSRMTVRRAVLFALGLSVGFVVQPIEARAEDVFVQVSTAAVRGAPQHWARAIVQARYGEQLAVVQAVNTAKGGVPGWLQVRKGGVQGYIHRSAVTDRRVVIQGRKVSTAVENAQSGDIVLAGKGFNAEVEGAYASRKAGANFAEVDRMLARNISDDEVASFIQSGKLGGTK